MSTKHAPSLKSTQVALKMLDKKVAGNPSAARAALAKLGTHTRTGAIAAKYK